MEIRKGFERALIDIKDAFEFLLSYGFKMSGETSLEHRVSVGYQGADFNILLSYEFMESEFDFTMINSRNANEYKPLWKLVQENSNNFIYESFKPNQLEYKVALYNLAGKFKVILPSILEAGKL